MPFATRGGVRLFYEEAGTGRPIVWVHEYAADYRTWEPQMRRFSRDYRCIAYNARGYPPSDVPETDAVYTYENQRDDLLAILDHLEIDRAHVVGLSMGAYTGLQFAMRYPERISSLVFASGGAGGATDDRERFIRGIHKRADRALAEGMPATADYIASSRPSLQQKDPRGWDEFRGYLAEHSALGTALTARNFQALRPSVYDLEDSLKTLDVPVLLAVGDEDDQVIETNIFLKRTLPRSGMWMMPKSGHGLNIEEPGAFNDVIAHFLSAVERGRWGGRFTKG